MCSTADFFEQVLLMGKSGISGLFALKPGSQALTE